MISMNNNLNFYKKLLYYFIFAIALNITWVGVDTYAQPMESISPVLEYVQDNGNGTYTAHWGYMNSNDVAAEAEVNEFRYKGLVYKALETEGNISGPEIGRASCRERV